MYQSTNESLHAIVAGMDLQPEDNVLAVAGSGDQAFAMLEYGCTVMAVDNKQEQIDFVRRRIDAIDAGNYGTFISNVTIKSLALGVTPYFDEEKFYRIKDNLDNLSVKRASVFRHLEKNPVYDKVYLSNVLSFIGLKDHCSHYLDIVSNCLPVDGTAYVADHNILNLLFLNKEGRANIGMADSDIISAMRAVGKKVNHEDVEPFLPNGLEIDQRLTDRALEKRLLVWFPAVYRKVA